MTIVQKSGVSKTETKKVAHATGLYLDGIRDGNFRQALERHTGHRYTQHSTGVPDGQEGFVEFFAGFIERHPVRDIQIVRVLEDGNYVFLHAYQNLNDGAARWVTADLFDTDEDGKVIEHWDVIQEYATETRSGHTMVDGPTEIEDLDKTEANKAHVRAFVGDVLLAGQFEMLEQYVSAEHFDQHNPTIASGLDGFKAHVEEMAVAGQPERYWKVHHLVGQGNFVATLSHTQIGRSHYAVFDLFRLKDGLIVEHWDAREKILAPEEWNNQGKF